MAFTNDGWKAWLARNIDGLQRDLATGVSTTTWTALLICGALFVGWYMR